MTKKLFLVVTVISAVGVYIGMQMMTRKFSRLQKASSINPNLRGDAWNSYRGKHWRHDSINENCSKEYKNSHYLLIDFHPGRTGSNLYQLYCGLVTALRMCYTVAIEQNNRYFVRAILPYFDLSDDFKIMKLNKNSFHPFQVSSDPLLGNATCLSNTGYNRTLGERCKSYTYAVGYEDFIRASIQRKKDIIQNVSEYLGDFFSGRSLVAVHVRRTDKLGHSKYGYNFSSLEWYKPHINRAMDYLQSRYSNLCFIFVSDDKQWCTENFHGDDIYFSPFTSPGMDLELMTRCDHVILTIGTFGIHGAWLSRPKTVIFNSKCVPKPKLTHRQSYLPQWIDIGLNDTTCLF